jgi:hypothetical protein
MWDVGETCQLLASREVVGHHRAVQGPDADVARGRQACADAAWLDASAHLSRADEVAPLEPGDLELLATAFYMLGNDAAYAACLERAHSAYLAAGNTRRAFGVRSGSATTACSAVTRSRQVVGSPARTGCSVTRTASRPATC